MRRGASPRPYVRTILGLTVAAVLGAALPAQLARGTKLPEFTWVKAWNGAPASFADLTGKVLVIDFVHSRVENCKLFFPRLVELHQKYADRGVVVLGVSEEAEGEILKFHAAGATYPFVKSNDLSKKFKVRFLPSTWVVDANGFVYSLPDLGAPDDTTVDELLQGLPIEPLVPAGAKWDSLRGMLVRAEYARLREHIEKTMTLPKLDDETRKVLEDQKGVLAKREEQQLARVTQLENGPDYTAHAAELERIEKSWSGHPPAAAARKVLDRFAGDATITKEITAGRALRKLVLDVDTSKLPALRKLIEDLDRFRKKNADVYAGKLATAHYTRLCMRPKPE
jgi:thiol-disulfide isomerase/thioredoxin